MVKPYRRTGGSNIGKLAVATFICRGCGSQALEKGQPKQCFACGRMDFIRFSSRAEARRYGELQLLVKAGQVKDLKLQTRWPLVVRLTVIGHYVSDFDYIDAGNGHKKVVEDTKGGAVTDLFEWKKKHFEAQYGITLTIIQR